MKRITIANRSDEENRPDDPDADKALVMAEFARLVDENGAVMSTLEGGTLELRLATGEVFHLEEEAVTRIA